MSEIILSAGIDIGTTTTQVIFSRLTMEKTGGYGVTPKVEVTNREVIYKSNIYFTPLTRDDEIDSEQVAHIISMEYENAGMTPDMLGSGAVIITGESAKKRNARMVTESIAELAGEFVVASAGPNLESLLAGKGSGAAALSQNEQITVLNLDIGGGTTNHMVTDQNDLESLASMLVASGCHYFMGLPQGDDVMLMYQSSGFHDIAALRALFSKHPIEEFEKWLEKWEILKNGKLGPNAGDPTIFIS